MCAKLAINIHGFTPTGVNPICRRPQGGGGGEFRQYGNYIFRTKQAFQQQNKMSICETKTTCISAAQ